MAPPFRLALIHSISLPPGVYGGDEVERLFTNRLDWDAHPYFQKIRGLTVSSHAVAVIHVALGEHRAAFEWLDRAGREHDRALVWLKVHPRLDPVRSDPRFEELLHRVGFAS